LVGDPEGKRSLGRPRCRWEDNYVMLLDNNPRRNTAMNKLKRFGFSGYFKIGTWNIRGICHRENGLENELKKLKVDIAAITETKKKAKGSKELNEM
jgi:hypothetical protein